MCCSWADLECLTPGDLQQNALRGSSQQSVHLPHGTHVVLIWISVRHTYSQIYITMTMTMLMDVGWIEVNESTAGFLPAKICFCHWRGLNRFKPLKPWFKLIVRARAHYANFCSITRLICKSRKNISDATFTIHNTTATFYRMYANKLTEKTSVGFVRKKIKN